MSEDKDLNLFRREFMAVGAMALAGSGGDPILQQTAIPDGLVDTAEDHGFVAAPILFGPLSARPGQDGRFFSGKTGVFVYQTDGSGDGSGEKYWIAIENGDVISGWNEFPMPIPTNQLNEVQTQNEISFFNHTFARPNAPDTKNWSFTAADVTKQNSEIELAATTTLETRQRGNYPPGSEATAGVAFRLTGTPTAGSAFAGYFDANDGILVGEDTTDSFVELRKGGTSKKVRRSNWNGHDPGERVWDNNRPVITRFPHLFYGGGDIVVKALLHDDDSSELRELHRFTPTNVDDTFTSGGPPLDQPNLPARFESDSLSGGNLRANAAHYQFALSETENRVNGEHITDVSAGTSGWTPLIAWRKRTNWEMVNVRPLKISISAEGADAKLELQLNPGLSGGTWSRPTHTGSSETAVEINTGVSLDSNGERRWPGYVVAGQGNQPGAIAGEDLTFNLPANQDIVLAAQGVGSSATLSGAVSWQEYF